MRDSRPSSLLSIHEPRLRPACSSAHLALEHKRLRSNTIIFHSNLLCGMAERGCGIRESEVHSVYIEQYYEIMEAIWRSAEATCQHSRQICEEAGDAQERAREIMRISRLARQRRKDVRDVIQC